MIFLLLLPVQLFLITVSGLQGSRGEEWYQGCYAVSKTRHQDSDHVLRLVPCAKHCLQEGSRLVAVGPGTSCTCLNDTRNWDRLEDTHCLDRCEGVSVPLSCGGGVGGGGEGGRRSVYLSTGPYLLAANTSITAPPVVTYLPHTLQATARLASLGNCSTDDDVNEDDDDEDSDWRRQVRFVWEVEGERVETDVTACTPSPQAHAPFTFTRTGNVVISLTVSNAVSTVTTSLSVTVFRPRPRGLQLLPGQQTPLHTPSCVALTSHSNSNDTTASDPFDAATTTTATTTHRQQEADTAEGDRASFSPHVDTDAASAAKSGRPAEGTCPPFRARRQDQAIPGSSSSTSASSDPRRNDVDKDPDVYGDVGDSDDVEMAMMADEDDDVRDDDDDDGVAMVAAFAGERFELVAGVRSGVEPRFELCVVDSEGHVVRQPFNVPQPTACLDPHCQAVAQDVVFPSPGVYTVHVTASNQFGHHHAPLTVVVKARQLGEVKVWTEEANDTVISSGQPLTLHLAINTADRHNAFLYVDFGDGVIGFAPLREMKHFVQNKTDNDSGILNLPGMEGFHKDHLGDRHQLLTGMKLTASYGERCDLQVQFQHKYTIEGKFVPHVLVVNNVTGETVSSPLPSSVVVLNRLSSAVLHAPTAATVGVNTTLALQLQPTSAYLNVSWLVLDKWNDTLVEQRTDETQFTVVFNKTGLHTVRADAENALGRVQVHAVLQVQEGVQGLKVRCQPFPPTLSEEEGVRCCAQLTHGTHTDFTWDFGDSTLNTEVDETSNLSSRSSHLYVKQGVYNVSVTASNKVSSVTATLDRPVQVDTEVRCLSMVTTPAAPNTEVFVEVTAVGGTRLTFHYDFGDRKWPHRGDVDYMPPHTTALLSHVYHHPGVYPVKLYADNPVSSAQLSSHVVVQPLVGRLQVAWQASSHVNTSYVLLVKKKGRPVERNDLIYHLRFSDGTNLISASPILVKSVPVGGASTVNFTAFNQVDSFNKMLHLEPDTLKELQGDPYLHHEAIVQQNQEVTFTILDVPRTASRIEIDNGDGNLKVVSAKTTRWSHVFSSPGVHTVEVTIYGGGRAGRRWNLRSVLLVQQPIGGLRLTGPTHVGIDCHKAWKAEVSEGTHLVCRWTLGGEYDSGFTTLLQYERGFRAEGTYRVGIYCQNDVSQSSAALNVSVTYPLTRLRLHVPVSAHSHPTPITITVHGGRRFTMLCHYGDGTVEEFKSWEEKAVSVIVGWEDWQEQIPAYNVTVQHLYAAVGVYHVQVKVSNNISTLTRHKRAVVEEAISDIELFSDVPPVVNVAEKREWMFTAVVGSGDNLQFAWDFAGPSFNEPPISEGNTSVATHTFFTAGEYPVTVKVSNHLQRAPVTASLPAPVIVQHPVTWINQTVSVAGKVLDIPGAFFHQQRNSSDNVTFKAQTDGAPVMFLFDFGDGKTQELTGVNGVAKTTHLYTAEGVYRVAVTARNLLSNMTTPLAQPLYIQVPVQGPLFEPNPLSGNPALFCTPFDQETALNAAPRQGSNVTFTWKLDDETEFVNANGSVRHKYRQPGRKTVEVTASNQVSSVTNLINVDVVQRIQSVNVSAERVVAAGEQGTYEAQVFPKGTHVSHYTWDLSRTTCMVSKPLFTYTYPHSGLFRVTVTAHNCHSNAISVPIEVRAVSPLAGLRFETKGDHLVNESIKFSVLIYQGDMLNFTWNFGDGSPPVRTKAKEVWHKFDRTGEYMVELLAENPLSRDSFQQRLFLLTQHCKPPTVTIVGVTPKPSTVLKAWKWQALRVESQVTLNCSVTGELTYKWCVDRLQGSALQEGGDDWSGKSERVRVESHLLHHPQLLLPPHTLSLGLHLLTLQVSMNGTEIPVYQEVTVRVQVMKTQVRSEIRGGVLRRVSRSSILLLDGTGSSDPDNNTALLNYTWSCHPHNRPKESCFNESALSMDGGKLEVNGAWFTADDSFLFKLTVSAPGSQSVHGSQSAQASQLVQLVNRTSVIPLMVSCKQCRDGWVNSNDKVSLVAHCDGHAACKKRRLGYRWTLSMVQWNAPGTEDVHKGCVMADGSSYKLLKLATTVATVTTATPSPHAQTSTTTSAKKPQSIPEEDVDSSMDSSGPMEEFIPVLPWQTVEEADGPRSRTETSRRGQSSRTSGGRVRDFYSVPEEGSSDTRPIGLGIPLDIGEGTLDVGSGPRRNMGMFLKPQERKTSPENCAESDFICWMNMNMRIPPLPPHISERSNTPINLRGDDTASLPDGPSLVLTPGTLSQNRTYLVQVTVIDPDDPEAEGMAMTYFMVNKSPGKGACSVQPSSGVEMDTVFRVFCKEWQDEQLPVWYEVSYSLSDDEAARSRSASGPSVGDRQLVYRGLSHQVAFRLPAGLPQYGRKVFLRLSIRDSWGASTSVCHIPIAVAPHSAIAHHHDNTTGTHADDHRQSLDHEVQALLRHLQTSVYRGDVTGVVDSNEVFTHLAMRLNSLVSTTAHSSNTTTNDTADDTPALAEIRFGLLQAIRHMPLRDEVEVEKSLRCLLHATRTVSQIDGPCFVLGVQLLEKISRQSGVAMSEWRHSVERDNVGLVVQVVSNLLQAATHSPLMLDVENIDHKRFHWMQRALDVVQRVITLALYDHTLGEVPLSHHTDFVTVTASHYPAHWPSSINISHTSFHLPAHISSFTKRPALNDSADGVDGLTADMRTSADEDDLGDCYQARVTSFQRNPFVYRKETLKENIDVQSEVVSLDVFSCDGEQHLLVDQLKPDINVEFVIPLKSSVESTWEHELSRSHMSIHQFNMTESQENLYLTLLVNLVPIPASSQPFPITAIISEHWPPRPQHSIFRQDFQKEQNELRIFISPGSLNGAGTYNLGLVETSLNSGRRHKTEVVQRQYALSAWFGSCVFWNTSRAVWSDQGCRVSPRTTATVAHCRCDHLTAFGSHFELVPNDLSFTHVEHFFSLHENPVVIVLVAVVMVIYIILLVIALRADAHDRQKGGLVCLSDNNITDSQIYEVVLDTGLSQSTPSTAKVSIILHGELGMSETRELISEDDRPMFDRSSRDRFLITLPDSLGRISKVQLWHDNAGTSPRWFLTQVLVRDLNAGKVQYFLCDKWFAVDEGDGRVERELVALDNAVSFMQIFVIKSRQYMADFHAWGSVFTRPAHSIFTRAQRLTCCLTLLMAYMALNAVWYKRQPEQRRGEFGLLDVSWRSLAVGAICCAVVFPLYLFLTFLFRRSRVRQSACEHRAHISKRMHIITTTTTTTTTHSPSTPCTPDTDITPAPVNHRADSAPPDTTESTQTITTYSLLDQSILNWQSIQDWAQRQWVKRQQSTRSSAVSVKTNVQPSTQPYPTQPVQHTLLADEETDQASSGFEDAVSQATAERHRVKLTSESSSESRPSHSGEEDGGGHHICLPAWCRYIAWTLCIVICTVSATVTILYGFRFGPTKSMFWLQSLYFSFMICIFFAQPFWIIVTVVYLAVRNRNNPAVFDHCCQHSQMQDGITAWHSQQKQILENSDESTELERGVKARQRSRYLRFSRPPQEKFLHESRKKLMKEKNAANFLREAVVFTVMFTLVCVMAYGKDLSPHFMLKQSMDAILLRGGPQSFHEITDIPDWHRWAQGSLLDSLYGTNISHGLLMKDGFGDNNNVVIGYPVIRQLRVKEQPCPHLTYMVDAAQLCRYGYGAGSQDVEGADESWMSAAKSSMLWGEMALYSAGGFTVLLNHTSKEAAMTQLKALETGDWLDRRSRAVIMEMTVLNVPTSLFSSVVLLLELPPTGGALPTPTTTSTCLFRYVSTWDNCVLACELLFVLLAVVKVQGELAAMIDQGGRYFTWPWNYAQMLLCLTGLGYIVCYIYRFVLVSEAVEFLRNTYYEQFISLAFLAAWDELLRSLVGLLLFLVVVTQGLRLLRYCPHLAKFAAIYRRARREVMLTTLLFFIFIASFSNLGALLFGTVSFGMRTTWSAALTTVALTAGIYDPPDLEVDGSPWFAIFSVFCFTLTWGLLTVYVVAVLSQRLRVNKKGDLLVMGKCELVNYCLQQLLLFVGVRKHVPHHTPQADLPPECTLAEFEYQVEELLFRMNALAGTTNLPEKPTGYFTDSDQSQAVGDDGISSGGSEAAVERGGGGAEREDGRLEQRVQKIEDKLYANEPYLAQLLKLDSIGTDILSQEKEKKIRSHLEMEIFRQLQMRRQETRDDPGPDDPQCMSAPQASASEVKAQRHSTLPAPTSEARTEEHASRSKTMPSMTPSKRGDSDEERTLPVTLMPGSLPMTSSDDSPGSERALLRGEPEPLRPKLKSGRLASSHLGSKKTPGPLSLKNIELHETSSPRAETEPASPKLHASDSQHLLRKPGPEVLPSSSVKEESVPASETNRQLSDVTPQEQGDSRIKSHEMPAMEGSDSRRFSGGKKHLGNLPAMERSDSIRGVGKRHPNEPAAVAAMERSDSIRSSGKKPELPPKPTFAVVPVIDSRRSPKPPPLKMPAERVLHRADTGQSTQPQPGGSGLLWPRESGGSGALADSSSGSDPDGLFTAGGASVSGGRRGLNQGRRNLRKTKSRGKGKGAGTLTPTLLLDELSFTVHQPPAHLAEVGDIVIEKCPPHDG